MARRRNAAAAERWLPLGYFAAALLLVVVTLPTVLRPPQQPPTQSAELSPDAPADDEQQSIIAALGRASTGTAGGSEGAGDLDGPAATAPPVPAPRPRFCPRGFGDPPRQVESLYSAPCAAAFSGNNGGGTAKGVTATEVRVALSPGQAPSGPIPTERRDNEDVKVRFFRVFQEYFNRNFQFYGRTLRFFGTSAPDETANGHKAAAVQADQEFGVFAAAAHDPGGVEEFSRRGIPSVSDLAMSGRFLAEHRAYQWAMDGTMQSRLYGEYLCKKLAGKPPAFNERLDATFDYRAPRKFGLIYYEGQATDGPAVKEALAACGETFEVELVDTLNAYANRDAGQNAATAMTRMKAAGVTTILPLTTYLNIAAYTGGATAQGYYPEWLVTSTAMADWNRQARKLDPSQWRHAFGISSAEIPQPLEQTDCHRAYHSIDPDTDPETNNVNGPGVSCLTMWPVLLQIANGIQMAGPKLTRETFHQGLLALGYRAPSPRWTIGGGYGPDDWSFSDYVVELWWDPTAVDPLDGTGGGAYRYVRGGQRYRLGELPVEDPPVFQDGVTSVSE